MPNLECVKWVSVTLTKLDAEIPKHKKKIVIIIIN
jgi:hypothetical protein